MNNKPDFYVNVMIINGLQLELSFFISINLRKAM